MSVIFNNPTVRRGGIVKDGLVLNLDAADTFSYPRTGSTWFDLSGNGNHFTIQGSPTFSSNFFTLPGNNITDYFILNPFSHPTVTSSIEIWLAANSGSSADGIWSYATSAALSDNHHLLYDPSNLAIYLPNGPTSGTTTGVSVADGNWRHIVATSNRTSGSEIVYVNGQQIYSGTIAAGSNFTSGGSLVLGQEQDSVGGTFDVNQAFAGKMSIFRVYNRVLSRDEIRQNFDAHRGRFGI